MELRSIQEAYWLQNVSLPSLGAHCCSSHQNCKTRLPLIWWQAPHVPYEKGVNKMHIGNIKQGQGRQFGWRPFFKCGKQKNKIVLAVAAVRERQLWLESGSQNPRYLFGASPIPQFLPNSKWAPQALGSHNRKKEEENLPILLRNGALPDWRDAAAGRTGASWGREGSGPKPRPAVRPPLSRRDEWRVLLAARWKSPRLDASQR